MSKLWGKSWDIIGAFFKDMKKQVLNASGGVSEEKPK
jgi:hypothetical protein